MKSNKLILVGGGGHCKAVIDVAESVGYEIIGIIDTPDKIGTKVLNYPVIASDDEIVNYVDKAQFLVTVGQIKSPDLRIKLHNHILNAGGKLATIIAKTAYVSKYAKIGKGTVIMHHAMINADAVIGKGCIINTFANIEHDTMIEDFCHISTGAMINGNCKIGRETFIGSQSVTAHGIEITNECIIAAGTFIRKNLHIKGIYAGNPAKKYK